MPDSIDLAIRASQIKQGLPTKPANQVIIETGKVDEPKESHNEETIQEPKADSE